MTRESDAAPEQGGGEPFLSRWSRRKQEARQAPAPADAKPPEQEAGAPQLPPIDQLTPESDFRAFFHPKVGEDVRRAALKKLFSDPHFNVMDGLDVYIDDYSKTEPIPAAMMAGLKQAQDILNWAREHKEMLERQEAQKLAGQPAGEDALGHSGARADAATPAPGAALPAAANGPRET